MLFLLGLFTRRGRTIPLSRLIEDPRGPEAVTSTLSDADLADLLDRVYRHLDTPHPHPFAGYWYDVAVKESYRRTSRGTTQVN